MEANRQTWRTTFETSYDARTTDNAPQIEFLSSLRAAAVFVFVRGNDCNSPIAIDYKCLRKLRRAQEKKREREIFGVLSGHCMAWIRWGFGHLYVVVHYRRIVDVFISIIYLTTDGMFLLRWSMVSTTCWLLWAILSNATLMI
jgi:hypothetical protein